MPYKFLILDTYYPEFLNDLYRDNVDLAYSSYHAQKELLLAQCFWNGRFLFEKPPDSRMRSRRDHRKQFCTANKMGRGESSIL